MSTSRVVAVIAVVVIILFAGFFVYLLTTPNPINVNCSDEPSNCTWNSTALITQIHSYQGVKNDLFGGASEVTYYEVTYEASNVTFNAVAFNMTAPTSRTLDVTCNYFNVSSTIELNFNYFYDSLTVVNEPSGC